MLKDEERLESFREDNAAGNAKPSGEGTKSDGKKEKGLKEGEPKPQTSQASHIAALEKEKRSLMKKYRRGVPVKLKAITDKKLKGKLKYNEDIAKEAQLSAAEIEKWLLPSEGGLLEAEGPEHSMAFKQKEIVGSVDLNSQRLAFDLSLPELGPYRCAYSPNSRSLLLSGEKGHVALMDWRTKKLISEMQLQERLRDACFLHNDMFFATAQRKYCYIYDKRGIELHRLKHFQDTVRLAFLPHHFLLVGLSKFGNLNFLDTSTGHPVAQYNTKKGKSLAMCLNPSNGITHLGHSNGTVTLWSPNTGSPLATLLCHRGPLTSLSVDCTGETMVTTGVDRLLKVWDLRKLSPVNAFFSPAPPKSLALSQNCTLAVGYSSTVQMWKKEQLWREGDISSSRSLSSSPHVSRSSGVKPNSSPLMKPYMMHHIAGSYEIENVSFAPYEDVLGVGHAQGFSSLLVPGSGEPNFDSFVANPFETSKQRKETEVHSLLDKLRPEMIALNPNKIASVMGKKSDSVIVSGSGGAGSNEGEERGGKSAKEKYKAKGRNRSSKRFRKSKLNIIDEKRQKMVAEQRERKMLERQQTRKEGEAKGGKKRGAEGGGGGEDVHDMPSALTRFTKRFKSA